MGGFVLYLDNLSNKRIFFSNYGTCIQSEPLE